jgi:hypothetical protein
MRGLSPVCFAEVKSNMAVFSYDQTPFADVHLLTK